MIFKIAFKNVWRNKVRSMIVIVAIMLGLTGGILTTSIMTGLVDQKIRKGIANEISHIQVHHPGYLKNFEAQYSIVKPDSIARIIAKTPGVKAVCQHTRLTGMAASSNAAAGIQVVGIDPSLEKQVSGLYMSIPDSGGGYFTGLRKNQVIIGRKLADKLKIRLKSKMVIRYQNNDGNLTEAAFTVNGIFQTSNPAFDESTIFVKKHDLDLIAGSDNGVQEILVLLDDIDLIPSTERTLRKKLGGLDVENWMEIRPEMGYITSAIALEVYILLGIILFALAFGIVNTMLMIVFERTKELGMLMAVGMSKSGIFRMIMLETIFLTVIGGVIGMIISAFLVGFLHRHGIDLSSVSKGLGAYGFDTTIYPFIRQDLYFHLSLMIIGTGILSAIMPARKALKLKPVEAIRGD